MWISLSKKVLVGWILHDIMSQIAPEKFQQIGFNYGESSLDSDFTSEDYT